MDRRGDEVSPDLVETVRKGLPYQALVLLIKQLGLDLVMQKHLTQILGIPDRTLARRKSGRFTPTESDRLYRVFRTVAQANETFGDAEKARRWLLHPNRALAGQAPLSLLDTDIGARQVENVLLRIEHGMHS